MNTTSTLTTSTADRAIRLVRSLKPGPDRTGQVAMIREVARVLDHPEPTVTMIQAPTGSGKSLALLAPLAEWLLTADDDERAIYLTHTKSLQDQLARDLPGFEEATGMTWAVLKGRTAYVCRQRLDEVMGDGKLEGTYDVAGPEIQAIAKWLEDPDADGDADREGMAMSSETRQAIHVSAAECPGSKCPKAAQCYGARAHARARSARLTVTNMAMFAADVAADGNVLPPHTVVFVDEGHRFVDAMAQGLGVEVRASQLRKVATAATKILGKSDGTRKLAPAVEGFEEWTRAVAQQEGTALVEIPFTEDTTAVLWRLRGAIDLVRKEILALCDRDEAGDVTRWPAHNGQRTYKLASTLSESLAGLDREECVYVEGRDVLRSATLDVGSILNAAVWPNVKAVVTSATIPTNLGRDLGLRVPLIKVPSPFNFAHNSLIYYAGHLDKPDSPEWWDGFLDETTALIDAAGGRTLGLFSSFVAMERAADELARRTGLEVLHEKMGIPKSELIRRFRSDPHVCLFGSQGLYEGLDVQGDTCSLVVINKVPFPHFKDPLTTARQRRYEDSFAGFMAVSVPHARMLTAQAAGRLIRSTTDRGVVAIFDGRITTKRRSWGAQVVADLDELGMPRTKNLSDACDYLRHITTTQLDAKSAAILASEF